MTVTTVGSIIEVKSVPFATVISDKVETETISKPSGELSINRGLNPNIALTSSVLQASLYPALPYPLIDI